MAMNTEKVKICGARPSKGSVDGVEYDYTELSIEEHLDPETSMGVATVPYKYGKSSNYHNQFAGRVVLPAIAEVDFLTITNGRGSSKRIVSAVRFPQKAAA